MSTERFAIKFIGVTTALSATLGGAIMAITTLVAGSDPSRHLAQQLNAGGGVAMGAILGGLLGMWLSIGGMPRAAKFLGWSGAIMFGILLWRVGRPIVWVFDVVLEAIFGPSARGLGPFVGIGVLLALVRAASRTFGSIAEDLVARLTSIGASPANRPGDPSEASPG